MSLDKKISIMISTGLVLALFSACGSGAKDSAKANEHTFFGDDNSTPSSEHNMTDTLVAGSGVLVETIAGKTITWVNSTSDDFCKVSRSSNRSGTVYEDGVGHCQGLSAQNYAGINSWRLPTVSEAKNLMKVENKSLLLFPASNPNCAIMTTDRENTFVYTTSDWNSRDNNPIGGEFIDKERNSKTAGIRCVATTIQ